MDIPLVTVVNESSSVLAEQPLVAITYITLLTIVALLGSLGNSLVLASLVILLRRRGSRDHVHGYAFLCNLACSDMIVTFLINPFAVLGEKRFDTIAIRNISLIVHFHNETMIILPNLS